MLPSALDRDGLNSARVHGQLRPGGGAVHSITRGRSLRDPISSVGRLGYFAVGLVI